MSSTETKVSKTAGRNKGIIHIYTRKRKKTLRGEGSTVWAPTTEASILANLWTCRTEEKQMKMYKLFVNDLQYPVIISNYRSATEPDVSGTLCKKIACHSLNTGKPNLTR
jgi:hypothetical protein